MNHYQISDAIEKNHCNDCKPCLRLKLIDMGFIPGQKIDVRKTNFGLYMVHLKSHNDIHEQTFALREDEFERPCILPL
jgi:Fe2+ transport system protein FeoA